MSGHHGAVAVLLAVGGALLLVLGAAAEWAAPLFSVALVEAGFHFYQRWLRRERA